MILQFNVGVHDVIMGKCDVPEIIWLWKLTQELDVIIYIMSS